MLLMSLAVGLPFLAAFAVFVITPVLTAQPVRVHRGPVARRR